MSNICILMMIIEKLHKNYNQYPWCLRRFLFRKLFQFIKVKLVFHIRINIVTKYNYQRSNQPLNIEISFYFWDKLLYVFLETNKGRCGQQLKFTTKNCNKELNLFWTSQIWKFKLFHMHNCLKPFSLNGQ